MEKKTNFVIFIVDQMRLDYLGCNGHKIIKTPNIDKIASVGTNFSNFFVASQVCMPNRASLMTGRYPSVHGLRFNGNYLKRDAVTFVDVLSKAGYKTSSVGKIHLQPMTTKSGYSWIKEDALGSIKEAWWPDKNDYTLEQQTHYEKDEYFDIPKPYYGFQNVDLVSEHGHGGNAHYIQWLRANLPDWEKYFDPKNEIPHNYSCKQAYRTPIPEEFYPTCFVEQKTVEFLNSIKKQSKPFISFVSFPDPHHPFTPPGKYWGMYNPEDFDVNLEYNSHKNPIEPMKKVRQMYLDGLEPELKTTVFMAEKRQIQESMALTAGMITMIDDAIGNIISSLEKNDLYEDTVVIFTSDHGDYLGDFSLMLKGALPFNSITNVPFIWSDPLIRKAKNSNALSSTIDIAPTILNRANVKPYWGIQGIDIMKSITNNESLRKDLMIEYHDNMARFGFDKPAFVRSLTTNEYRFTLYKDEPFGELYNLKEDPNETNNLFDNPTLLDIKLELTQRLINQMMENMDKSPAPSRLA